MSIFAAVYSNKNKLLFLRYWIYGYKQGRFSLVDNISHKFGSLVEMGKCCVEFLFLLDGGRKFDFFNDIKYITWFGIF